MVDVGGSGVKLATSSTRETRRFKSSPDLTPQQLVAHVLDATASWQYDAIALGYPGAVAANRPVADPGNLGPGWVGFDFEAAWGRPVRVANDAVMQALGAYEKGRMLFIGLGTGVGSALVSEHVLIPLELGSLAHPSGGTLFERLGRKARSADRGAWQRAVTDIVPLLKEAFLADYVVLGGGNASKVDPLPADTRRGGNRDAFTGGFRLWEETVEPHDRPTAAPAWRIVR